MRIGRTCFVLGLALFCGREVSAGLLVFQAHNPGGSSAVNIYTSLIPGNPISPPPSPSYNLSDPTQLLLTQQVQNDALFSFGMQGTGGEAFGFTPSQDSLALFTATGSQGTIYHAFFDAFYTNETGTQRPFHLAFIPGNPVIPGNPIFPPGSFSIDYTLQQDPPFTVGISIFAQNGDNLIFSAVPEPDSCMFFVQGAVLLAVFGWMRKVSRGRQVVSA